MLILVSPTKTLDYQSPLATTRYTQPEPLEYSQQLIGIARKLTTPQIGKLMSISDKLADLNVTRFHDWHPDFTPQSTRQATFAFKDDVYTDLRVETLTEDDFDFAQRHLRTFSDLYGVLRPLDLMQLYRLEVGIYPESPRGKDLYQFWGKTTTGKLNQALQAQGDDIAINLVSNKYFKSVKTQKLQGRLTEPVFLDEKNGKFKVTGSYTKKARDLISCYITENRLIQPEQLKAFNNEGYFSDVEALEKGELVFKRHGQ